ncbi:MAG: CPBP family intramembrane glutamic endopeptidase [Pseudomonadota bacterium]
MMGPYNTPLTLAREPLMAFFWAVLAPVLFLTGGVLVAQIFIPAFEPGSASEIEAHHTLWLATCVAMGLWFAVMSAWSEWLGAGAFAGQMRASTRWIVIALLAGPVLLIGPNIVVSSFMQEDGWQYREEVNEALFAPQNWSLAYLFIAVILAPIVEEVAFRGVAFGALISRGLSGPAAIVLSSLAFAISHLQYSPAAMLIVFVSGVGFAVLRLLSGTVLVPIVAHMTANAVVLLLNWIAASPAT